MHDLFVCLFCYCFTSHSNIYSSYEDVTIDGERLQNIGLSSGLMYGSVFGPHKQFTFLFCTLFVVNFTLFL